MMHERRTWSEFREYGMLWFVNRILHVFGWAICLQTNKDTGEVLDCFPIRTKCRGFSEEGEDKGFRAISEYMAGHAGQLVGEVEQKRSPNDNRVVPPEEAL